MNFFTSDLKFLGFEQILIDNFNTLDETFMSKNNIIKLLRKNKNKIDWEKLSQNENEYAIEILKENPDIHKKEPSETCLKIFGCSSCILSRG